MLDLNLIGPGTADDWPAALSQIDALFSYTAQQPPRLRPFAFELGRMTRQGGVAPAVDSDSPHQPRCGQATRTRTSCTQPRRRRASPRWARCSQAVGRTRNSGRCWSVHIQPDWIVDFVLALPAPLPLDVFTYHMYEGYGKAPRIAAQVPTVALIN